MRFALLALYATIASAVKLEHMLQAATDANAIETALAAFENETYIKSAPELPPGTEFFVAIGDTFDAPEQTG